MVGSPPNWDLNGDIPIHIAKAVKLCLYQYLSVKYKYMWPINQEIQAGSWPAALSCQPFVFEAKP
jgi:hypothetical protein